MGRHFRTNSERERGFVPVSLPDWSCLHTDLTLGQITLLKGVSEPACAWKCVCSSPPRETVEGDYSDGLSDDCYTDS